jgi:serine/threonine-protein kinase
LERRKTPRTNVGDTTMLLQRMAGGDPTLTSMPQAAGAPPSPEPQPLPARPMKHFLYGGIAVLAVAFAAILFLGKSETQPVQPPARIHNAEETNKPDTEKPKQEASTASTQITIPAPALEPAPAPEQKPAIKPAPRTESQTAMPSTTAASPHTEPAPQPAPVSEKKKTSVLVFAVSPWGEIYVDDEMVGIAPPLKELKVTPGKHSIEIRNEDAKPYTLTLNVASGKSMKIKHKFK